MIDNLGSVLAEHARWLTNPATGKCANLRAAILNEADLRNADLRLADLQLADLIEANLQEADLHGADIRWADLRGANLRWAALDSANLAGADLRGAALRGANLINADLGGTDLRGATGVLTLGPIGELGNLLYAVQGDGKIMVKAGSFWGPLPQFRAEVERVPINTAHGRAYMVAARMIADYAAIYWTTQAEEDSDE